MGKEYKITKEKFYKFQLTKATVVLYLRKPSSNNDHRVCFRAEI